MPEKQEMFKFYYFIYNLKSYGIRNKMVFLRRLIKTCVLHSGMMTQYCDMSRLCVIFFRDNLVLFYFSVDGAPAYSQ